MEKGYIIYKGPSLINLRPIVSIVTLKSSNRKTGNMSQVWYLPADIDPVKASKKGADDSVCGQCPARQSLGGHCYVNLGQAPLSVYRAYKRGAYKDITGNLELIASVMRGRYIRLGAYGDPAAAPLHITQALLKYSAGHTGYTHQYKRFPELKAYVMASMEDAETSIYYQNKGWRTFRVKSEDAPLIPGEITCLSDSKGLSCIDCRLCNGYKPGVKNIVIDAHGTLASKF